MEQRTNFSEGARGLFLVEVNTEGRTDDAALRAATKVNMVAAEVHRLERFHDHAWWDTEVHQRCDEHVAREAARRVEIENAARASAGL